MILAIFYGLVIDGFCLILLSELHYEFHWIFYPFLGGVTMIVGMVCAGVAKEDLK
jgi:hypothetical protein